MADEGPQSAQQFAALVRKSLFKGFALPAGVLIFFLIAPYWLNHNVRQDIIESIQNDRSLRDEERNEHVAFFEQVNLSEVARTAPPGLERLKAGLDSAGVTRQFALLRWSLGLSTLLVALLALTACATFALNRRAQSSRDSFISSYRTAYRLGIAAALTKVVLLIPLLSYAIFELTTLAFQQYSPKLILVVILGGLIALWKAVTSLLKKVPLEFHEGMAIPITPAQSPELWADVKAAAQKLNTSPPDHILVGMQLNFYVTELAVTHESGRLEGRSLYLSLPLMRQLSSPEVMAIVGHELGHFRGEDTKLTREFYPMRYKADATLQALAAGGWTSWPSLHTLLFFRWTFGQTEQTLSREREYLADRAASELTSAETSASALIKVHVLTDAFNEAISKTDHRTEDIFAASLLPFVRKELAPRQEFWSDLLAHATPHPLDSHPPLKLRLESLGALADPRSLAEVATKETLPAYDQWFHGRDPLFAKIVGEASEHLGRIRTQISAVRADYSTAEGKQLLDTQFPEIRWKVRSVGLWTKLVAFAILGLLCLALIPITLGKALIALPLIGAGIFGGLALQQWRRHHGGEFVLNADSLTYTGWNRRLTFAEVTNITSTSYYGAVTLVFHFATPSPSIWKYSLLAGLKTKTVSLPIGTIAGKPAVVLATLQKYIFRTTDM